MKHAVPQHVFYPVATNDVSWFVQPDDRPVQRAIREDTMTVHLWHGQLKKLGLRDRLPPKDSYLGQALVRHDLDRLKSSPD